jgi:uncharacterized membrane protein YcaP (DUF421 family)
VEGQPIVLVDRGQIDQRIRREYMIAMTDLQEALRQEGLDGPDGLKNAVRVVLEPNGKISVIKKDPCKPTE